jgi:hypothetical protein
VSTLPGEPFSLRFGVRPRGEVHRPDDLPQSAKPRLVVLIDKHRGKDLPGAFSLGPRLSNLMGRAPQGTGDMAQVTELINSLKWWEFYDLCEEMLRISKAPDELSKDIEAVFVQENLPYSITTAGITWRLSEPAEEAVTQTRHLLSQPEFAGPSGQWERALHALSQRPPDSIGCIRDAIGAMEGLGRILSNRPNDTLGQITNPFATQIGMHPALARAISSIYGYRGDENGIGHGATSPLQVLEPEAEFILLLSAATMIYLTKKKQASV